MTLNQNDAMQGKYRANELSKRQRTHFNAIEDSYEKAVNDPKAHCYRNLLYRDFFAGTSVEQMLKGGSTVSVLEAMCGDGIGGRILKEMYPNSHLDYEGFDYSDEMVKEARRKHPELTFYQQDVNQFHTEKKYKIIMLLSGLHHVPDTAAEVMKSMRSFLEDGGCFVSVEPTYNMAAIGLAGNSVYKHSEFYDYGSERRFSLKELNGIFETAGFQIEKQIYPGMLAYLLWWFNPYPSIMKIGNESLVKKMYRFEKPFYSNAFGKKLSLAAFTILKK